MIEQIFSSTYIHLAVLFGFVIYVVIHQAQVDRIIDRNSLMLGFWDRLFLFRLPRWRPRAHLSDPLVAKQSRILAWQFTIVTIMVFAFYEFGAIYFGAQK
jgi:hypothetical protein